MPGNEAVAGSLFSYVDIEKLVRADHPLRMIREIVNATLKAMSPEFDALYSPVGRESIPPERLLWAPTSPPSPPSNPSTSLTPRSPTSPPSPPSSTSVTSTSPASKQASNPPSPAAPRSRSSAADPPRPPLPRATNRTPHPPALCRRHPKKFIPANEKNPCTPRLSHIFYTQ